ncbi:MAG TPA: YhfC family glutamic-type intramembrane protease [Candidatus Dormibacteraeota bacterium]|nr:YhfC family glutamic-type intramembrane protease [Candidatus Dormibacteraeota bacterium]
MNTVLYQQIVSGSLMMIVAVAAAVWWKLRSRVPWRWFWAGAGIWAVGVALKFALAKELNPIIIGTGVPPKAGLAAGVFYCGIMTGIFEIGITLAAALFWRRLAAEPNRAVAVGLGAGAFEALLLGIAAAGGSVAALATGQGDKLVSALAVYTSHTPLFWLAGPVERAIAIAAHTASRVLVLQAVAHRKWLGFWAGFAWLSLMDTLAGLALLTGMTTSDSIWWSESMFLPLGVLSIPLTRYALSRWPKPEPVPVEPMVEETV